MKKFAITIVIAAISFFCLNHSIQAQSSAFTYQGKLTDASFAANGQYDFQFSLYDSGGTLLAAGTIGDVQVTAGIFTVNLDFGPSLFVSNTASSLEIGVRPGISTGAYTTLAPRQLLTSAPFAVKATNATSSDSMSATCVLCVTDAHISTVGAGKINGVLTASQGGTGIGPTFPPANTYLRSTGSGWQADGLSGNGSALTNLNGANITNNTVNAAALTPEVTQSKLSLLGSLRWDLLRNQTNFPTGTTPRGLVFDGANMWITNVNSGNVTKLRASDGLNLGTFPAGSLPIGVVFDGSNIWVVNLGSNNLTKLRASDGLNLGVVAVGSSPSAIAFDGANIWVVNNGSNNVQKLRISDNVSLGTFSVPANSEVLAFDGANIWVVSRTANTATKFASDGTNLGAFPAGNNPQGVSFDGANMWFANNNPSGTVTKVRASDGVNVGTFSVGVNPSKLAFDGVNIWVSNGGGNNVTKLRASDGLNLGTFPVGTGPIEIAFDGSNIWVSNSNSNTVTRLLPAFP